ncbi:MFS transporter [Streptomyces sp. GC420]|uniref:MFS transporter n=1 Tax=Streptomyces sp. GC420 TaxID=2697568 RepID=UPI0014151944|nr:MFS transporter [Streptomyces sp. GC420]NBM20406.1 DHA2 family efflux MFS transporter permease subunit [Streptomyces sp. GC420]
MVQARSQTRLPVRRAPRTWAVVLAACAGQFLVVLDVSVVNVALPSMRTDLGLSATGLQWVLNAYAIAFAGFMLLGGRAADLYGRKRTFLAGLGLFTAASLAGGLAQEGWQLVAARAGQGLGAAVLAPATLTILTSAVPEGPARTRAIGTWSAVGAGGGAAGGLVGGLLTDGLSWRWTLLINVPVGALVLAVAAVCLAEGRDEGGRRRLDLPGAVLVTAGLAVLAYGIVQTEAEGWVSAPALAPLGAGVLLLAAFLVVEARTKAPLMPLKVFRTRAVWAANTGMFVCGSAMFCMWFFMTVYAQNVLGYSPLDAGLALVPSSLAVVLGSKLAPRLMLVTGARNLAVMAVLVAAAGFAWQSTMDADGSFATAILGPGVLMMAGAGLSATPLASLATSGADPGDAGLVSGLVNTSRTMGGALGLAVLSTVAASRTAGRTGSEALTEGYALAFRVAAGILLGCAAFLLLALPRPVSPRARARTRAGTGTRTEARTQARAEAGGEVRAEEA